MGTLALSSTSTTTTWYIPLYNYVGAVYISQIDSIGTLLGGFAWTNISALPFSTTYNSSNFYDAMVVSYNTSGGNYGLQITGADLTLYSVCVMYVGTKDSAGPVTFQTNNPAYPYYTINGTGATFKTDNSTYTSLEFLYGTNVSTTVTFSQTATLLDLGTAPTYDYTSYMLNGTSDIGTGNTTGGPGATCYALPTSSPAFTIAGSTTVTINIGTPGSPTSSIDLPGGTITAFTTEYLGGDGSKYPEGGDGGGGGGGSAGPGGSPANTTDNATGGLANTTYNNIGSAGQTAVGTGIGGAGGSGTNNATVGTGSTGAVVLTLSGYWVLYTPDT
jgi:hypothetical protein